MGKEANIRHKSTKLPVQLYRAFFKLCIAAVVYASFCVFKGGGIANTGFAVAVSILGAIAYEITYFVYKMRSKEHKAKDENMTWKQVFVLLRFLGYLVGLFLVVFYSEKLRYIYGFSSNGIAGKLCLYVALIILGLALCQQMHNNKYIFSHLSTFFESVAAGFTVITLELIYSSFYLHKYENLYVFGICITVVLYALSELCFHFYNCLKHGKKTVEKQKNIENKASLEVPKSDVSQEDKLGTGISRKKLRALKKKEEWEASRPFFVKKELILDRIAEFLRNALLVMSIWIIFILLIITGSVEYAISVGIYDKAIVIIPIIISIATPIIDSQKQTESAEAKYDKYDPRISPEEFKDVLCGMFGENSLSIKALDYVVSNMNKKNHFVRYNGEDYFVHPIAVAKLLTEHTYEDDEVIAAALLHDCVEDMPECTVEKIKAEYGEKVAEYVRLVSKEKGKDYHNPEIMRAYLDKIAENKGAALIKTADRINNMNTLDNCTDTEKQRKFEQTRRYYPRFIDIARKRDTENEHFYEFAEKCFEDKKY